MPHAYCSCKLKYEGRQYPILHCVAYDSKRKSIARNIIVSAKDSNYKALYEFIGDEMTEVLNMRYTSVTNDNFDKENVIITWITRRRFAERRKGHDQAREIAKRVSERTGAECLRLFLNHGVKAQKKLTGVERLQNARESFEFCGDSEYLRYKTVILIDDLVTTGAGMFVCADMLLNEGVSKIVMLSYGRTDMRKTEDDKN